VDLEDYPGDGDGIAVRARRAETIGTVGEVCDEYGGVALVDVMVVCDWIG